MIAAEPLPVRITPVGDGCSVNVTAEVEKGRLSVSQKTSELKRQTGESILTLRLVQDDGSPGAPIFGEYRRDGRTVHFRPRYRLVPGYTYLAVFCAADGTKTSVRYRVPQEAPAAVARVERVFPTSRVLPANHLKFYIHFSRPMREGRATFDRIHLFDEAGQEIPDPWRRTELWTADSRRLTLWIHPGRVKTGVNLREELGPVLRSGRSYTLVIDAGLTDVDGNQLEKLFRKQFVTTAADNKRPLPQEWRISRPDVGTQQKVAVRFPDALDHALLYRFIEVADAAGNVVPGTVGVSDSETVWQFTPDDVWKPQEYQLLVSPLLEDLAGNTPLRVFDTDLSEPVPDAPDLSVSFRPR